MHDFKEGDIVRRFFKASQRASKATYTVVKVNERGVWVTEGTLDGPAGMKPYGPDQLIPANAV